MEILIKQNVKNGYTPMNGGGIANLSYRTSATRRGRVIKRGEICPTIMAGQNTIAQISEELKIRCLTERELWRFMGFTDSDFWRAKYGRDVPTELLEKLDNRTLGKEEWKTLQKWYKRPQTSDTQLAKQAGNSIVVNVLEAIFGQMMKGNENA